MVTKEQQAQFLKDNVNEDMDTVALIINESKEMRIEECSWDYDLEDSEEVLVECFAPNPEIVEQDSLKNIIKILDIEDYS